MQRTVSLLALIFFFGLSQVAAAQDAAPAKDIQQDYLPKIRPLLKKYCNECHTGDEPEADFDLGTFATMADVRKQPKVWQKVRRMLEDGEMPPKEAEQLTDPERNRLRKWVRGFLKAEAKSRAGDPGRVILRRLSNSEYTYTLRDLTGIDSLDPAREFPIDGAAGEGFTNTGSSLVMSPSLVRKYLDAGKEVAKHAVLLPDGIRFSPHVTRRDRTDEMLAKIQAFYRHYSDTGGQTTVNLQGVKFNTNQGGRLPLEKYLAATLVERDALRSGKKTLGDVAKERSLNEKYLGALWRMLNVDSQKQSVAEQAAMKQSFLLSRVRTRWKAAKPSEAGPIATEIAVWQKVLWKFNTIGQFGRKGGPPAWQQAVVPIVSQQEFTLKLPKSNDGKDIVFYLSAGDLKDGNDSDYVVWKNARLEGNGQSLALRDVAGLQDRLTKLRREMLSETARYLAAVAEFKSNKDLSSLAEKHKLDVELLRVWLNYLHQDVLGQVEVKGHFANKLLKSAGYDFINGWGSPNTPSISANSSDQEVRIPGIARPHSIVVHPSPTQFVAIGWRSPINGTVRVDARLSDAHPECGNGVEWVVQHRSSAKTVNLGQGEFAARGSASMPAKKIVVRKGELISFVLGPRQGNHSCDLTAINFTVTETKGANRVWDLAKDVSGNILASNPHPDSHGNRRTWHFYQGKLVDLTHGPNELVSVPAGSLLAKWLAEKDATKRKVLSESVQLLAIGNPPADKNSPDAQLFQQLQTLISKVDQEKLLSEVKPDARFGKHPLGHAMESTDLVVKAPFVFEVRVPAELAKGRQLLVTGQLESKHGRDGSVQLQVTTTKPDAGEIWPSVPIMTTAGTKARLRMEQALNDFRNLFPIALCYARIVPTDEVVTLTLFYREDKELQRLMLTDEQTAQLNRLWDQLSYVSREPLKMVTAFEQIYQFATQDRPDLVKAFESLKKPINDRADAFRKRLINSEPMHVQAVLKFANRAWRRNLTDAEDQRLRGLYKKLRELKIPHDEAIRLTLARVLTSPNFLYRREQPTTSDKAAPISNLELANRLSYFLWSSMPDNKLRSVAEAGRLRPRAGSRPANAELLRQTRRMLNEARTRRLAIHFACQWLHIRDFDKNAEKNEKLYPKFVKLRGPMYEESVRFFEDMFRNDGSILEVLNADHTFLNESLANHYGIPWKRNPSHQDGQDTEWRRFEGVRAKGRGGILGMATVLASQSGASRTSPILRGNWVYETLLGERLPRPPANVPQLPEALPRGLTARQLIERHSSAASCARCHVKIDPYGFALEQFDAIGRLRSISVDTKTKLPDGKTIEGLDGLRDYLAKDRRADFVEQFCRKLLGYSLGREVQLSDEPLLEEIQRRLKTNNYRFSILVESIVTSRQFRETRGRDVDD